MTDKTQISPDGVSLLQSVRRLKRYTIIFTAANFLIAATTLGLNHYFRSLDWALKVYQDPVLVEKQTLIAARTDDGRCYSAKLMQQTDFSVAAKVLMNHYQTVVDQIDNWRVLDSVFLNNSGCSIVKHSEIFALGKTREGYWNVEGGPLFTAGEYDDVVQYVERNRSKVISQCLRFWTPVSKPSCRD